jgi:hypothetical protein
MTKRDMKLVCGSGHEIDEAHIQAFKDAARRAEDATGANLGDVAKVPESLYVVERLSLDCTHWSPVEFGAFVAEQSEHAELVCDQFIELYKGTRQFRIARYVRDDAQ